MLEDPFDDQVRHNGCELLYVDGVNGLSARFQWTKAPTSAELTQLAHTIAHRVGRFLERQGLLERDAENSYLAGEALEAEPLDQLLGHSITYRIAVGPHQGRKVFTLQTLPGCNERFDNSVGKVAGFSLHARVAARTDERKKIVLSHDLIGMGLPSSLTAHLFGTAI